MSIVSFGGGSVSSSSGFTPLTITSSSISSSTTGWSVAPTNLAVTVDGVDTTATGWGQVNTVGARGWVQFDLGTVARRLIDIRFGIRMASGAEGDAAIWEILSSNDGSNFLPIWSTGQFVFPDVEGVFNLLFWSNCRYLRFRVTCISWGAQLRIYEIRAWQPSGI